MMRGTVVTRSWTLKVHPLGKRLEEDNPVLNAQLADGSRLAVVIPPVVQPAPALTIRKVEYLSHSKSNPAAFRLDFADSEGALYRAQSPSKGNRERTNSEQDWAWVLHELAYGLEVSRDIGANGTIFSMVSRFVLRPAPVGDPSTVLSLGATKMRFPAHSSTIIANKRNLSSQLTQCSSTLATSL